jgi:hypothetical protein
MLSIAGAFLLLAFLTYNPRVLAQTYDLQLVVLANDGANLDLTIQIRSSTAFGLHSSNFVFTYTPTTDVSAPSLLAVYNFSGGSYSPLSLTNPLTGRTSINIVFNGGTSTTVPTTWRDVCSVRFPIKNPSGSVTYAWRIISPQATVAYKDMGSGAPEKVSYGNFTGLSVHPLPVELLSFQAHADGRDAQLSWETVSERENSGYSVERLLGEDRWTELKFIPRASNGRTENSYTYTDKNVSAPEAQYRLRMIDNDGSGAYSSMVRVQFGEPSPLPKLLGVFPSPLRSTGFVRFYVPGDQPVRLAVVDMEGREALTLKDGDILSTGEHMARLASDGLPAGNYIIRLQCGSEIQTLKLIIEK